MFEREIVNIYDRNSLNDMNRIQAKKVNNIAECNLLNYKINPSKRTKNINIIYSPIIRGNMNTSRVRAKFKSFLILLDS